MAVLNANILFTAQSVPGRVGSGWQNSRISRVGLETCGLNWVGKSQVLRGLDWVEPSAGWVIKNQPADNSGVSIVRF